MAATPPLIMTRDDVAVVLPLLIIMTLPRSTATLLGSGPSMHHAHASLESKLIPQKTFGAARPCRTLEAIDDTRTPRTSLAPRSRTSRGEDHRRRAVFRAQEAQPRP